MVRGIKINTRVPLDMTIADFWGKVGNYTDEGDIVFVSINITDITENELLKHSPFGSFTLIQEIDPDTKEPTGWYVFESFDYTHCIGVSWDETINDVLVKMVEIVKKLYKKAVEDIGDPDYYHPYSLSRFDEPDLFWFVRTYGRRLGIGYDIYPNELRVYRVSDCVFNEAED